MKSRVAPEFPLALGATAGLAVGICNAGSWPSIMRVSSPGGLAATGGGLDAARSLKSWVKPPACCSPGGDATGGCDNLNSSEGDLPCPELGSANSEESDWSRAGGAVSLWNIWVKLPDSGFLGLTSCARLFSANSGDGDLSWAGADSWNSDEGDLSPAGELP